MVECYVGLGSNQGDSAGLIRQALNELGNIPETNLVSISSLYNSAPVGPQDQPDFCNAVAALESKLAPDSLLSELQAIEEKYGRVRNGQRWGPRTLDLDLLMYGDQVIQTVRLTVPHREIVNRGFVLVPLLELNPEVQIPGMGVASEFLQKLDTSDIKKLTVHE